MRNSRVSASSVLNVRSLSGRLLTREDPARRKSLLVQYENARPARFPPAEHQARSSQPAPVVPNVKTGLRVLKEATRQYRGQVEDTEAG